MRDSMIDLAKRMTEIKEVLDAHTATDAGAGTERDGSGSSPEVADASAASATGPSNSSTTYELNPPPAPAAVAAVSDAERLLEELLDIVESIDAARDLATIGGLPTLTQLLASPAPGLRWRAAEVAAACVQNNPEVQASFLAAPGLTERLVALLADADADCRTKALLALASLVRGHEPAMRWWLESAAGTQTLVRMLRNDPDARVRRKAAQLLGYCLGVDAAQAPLAASEGLLGALCRALSDEADAATREAAADLGVQLARSWRCAGSAMRGDAAFAAAAQAALARLDALPREDWGAAREEAEALRALGRVLAGEELWEGDSSALRQQLAVVPTSGAAAAPLALT